MKLSREFTIVLGIICLFIIAEAIESRATSMRIDKIEYKQQWLLNIANDYGMSPGGSDETGT